MRAALFLSIILLVSIAATPAYPSATKVERQASPLVAGVDFVSGAIGWVALYSPQISRAGNACDYDLGRTPVTIARTTHGGRTWAVQLHFTGDSTVFGNVRLWGMWMRFVNPRDGFVAGPATRNTGTRNRAWLYRTRDGGKVWSKLRLPGIPGAFLGDPFSFPNASDGWILSDVSAAMGQSSANIFHTADGGSHWALVAYSRLPSAGTNGFRTGGDKNAIVFRNASIGWVTAPSPASPGLVYATTDGGKRWSFQILTLPDRELPNGFINSSGNPSPPSIVSSSRAYLPVMVQIYRAGNTKSPTLGGRASYLYLYSLAHDGVHWIQPRLLPGTDTLAHPMYWQLLSARRWWVGAGNTLRRTVNGGGTWQTFSPRLPKGFVITNLDFIGPNRGWAIATGGYTPGYPVCASILLRTSDAGAHWTRVTVGR